VAAKLAGKTGVVVASDILEMKPVHGVAFIKGDFTDDSVCVSVFLSVCPFISLSLCLFVCLCLCL